MSTTVLMPECCRCCLVEENDMIYVFDILDEFDSKICDLIATCGGVGITEDDIYSKNICGNCLNDLANAARFRERCLGTALILQNTTVETKEDLDDEQKDSPGIPVDGLIEEIIVEQIEDDETVLEFSEVHDENQSDIQYIIAEEPTESELRDFDYDNLISEQDDFGEEQVETICLQEVEKDDEASMLKPVQKEFRFTQPRPVQLNFVCQHCGAGFALQKNLARHLVMHQNYVCDICSEVFDSDNTLAFHRLSHPNDHPDEPTEHSDLYPEPKTEKLLNPKKNHCCAYCDKAFVSNSALVAHVRIHTQEKPFPCNYCTKRFRTVGAQELHERRHNGVKPYKCDLCGRGFAESSNLKVHRRTHTQEKPHVCTVCNRAFARVFLLQIHQRTHTGDRPFSCEDCGKSFSQQGDLAAHRRIHTGERPHRCDICGKGFIKSSGLTQHRRKHEQQDEDIRMVLVDTRHDSSNALQSIFKEEDTILEVYGKGVDELLLEDMIANS